jgi:Type I phosphodiesterase / nucleotide pyrophosphatase
MSKTVIVLEFNELVPALVDRFIGEGKLPHFERLRDESMVAVTDAEEEPPALEPWIQWVTVHTGLRFDEHKVFNLDEGAKLPAPRIWDLASQAGRPVWICGSMNVGVQSEDIDGLILPDPWSSAAKSLPSGLFDPYLNFIRAYVHEYTAERPPVGWAERMRFARFMLTNGLSLKTVSDTLRQLATERRTQNKWRRAVILDRLQWDVFRKFYRKKRPALATFFLNSTAHYQHYYWRDMEPHAFAVQSDEETQRKYADAILYGYQKMDEIIGEAFDLADAETSIVLCTALSQQPMLTHEETGGKQMFKPVNHAALLTFAGITEPYEYAPVMAQQFHLVFATEAGAKDAEHKIAALHLDGVSDFMLARRDGARLLSGCSAEAWPAADARVASGATSETIAFNDLFYPLESVRSGMHHPEGILWIRTPDRAHRIVDRKVSLTEIAPTLLELADVRTAHQFAAAPLREIHESNGAAERHPRILDARR